MLVGVGIGVGIGIGIGIALGDFAYLFDRGQRFEKGRRRPDECFLVV
jgi:hypothetical protein